MRNPEHERQRLVGVLERRISRMTDDAYRRFYDTQPPVYRPLFDAMRPRPADVPSITIRHVD